MKNKINSAKKFVKDHQVGVNVAVSLASGVAMYALIKKFETPEGEEIVVDQIETVESE